MREIKFRGQDENGRWVYGSYLRQYRSSRYYGKVIDAIVFLDTNDQQMRTPVNPKTVGQFTGLFDVEGVEIYEGDIIEGTRNNNLQHEVIWLEEQAAFGCVSPGLDIRCGINQAWITEFSKEIVGSIHFPETFVM